MRENLKTRRDVLRGLCLGGGSLLLACAPQNTSVQRRRPYETLTGPQPEPKSIHTWFIDLKTGIYNFDVDVRIQALPRNLDPRWLYFPSLQVNFDQHDEWGHGGIQWASGQKKINWGGGSSTGYGLAFDGKENRNLESFSWETGRWYRYRVWRLDKDDAGYLRWLFTVLDYQSGKEQQVGTLRTVSKSISGAVVFTETGYGVRCDTDPIIVQWRNPTYRTAAGQFTPGGRANYNGTCTGEVNTNQMLISRNPPSWYHATREKRATAPNTRLW